MKFELTILGSGAAIPTLKRRPTSQFINCNERYILIDCGEGAQLQMRKFQLKFQKIQFILISHLHGDHYFGLVGLLSSINLMGRKQKMTVFGPQNLESLIRPQLEIGGNELSYELEFKEIEYPFTGVLFEDKIIEITTFPLKHRIPTQGFIITEKQKPRTLDKVYFDDLKLSLTLIPAIKNGEDVVLEDGTIIPNDALTFETAKPKRYAYCSDTCYWESIIQHIKDVDLLYHEATFTENLKARAKITFHSTAKQAAAIAKSANVKKLVLGHFSSRYEDASEHLIEAQEVFTETICAEDGMMIQL